MKLSQQFVATAMLLVMLGVPAMACLAPEAQLTEQEKACCREKADQCGEMDMVGDATCCFKTVQQHGTAILKDPRQISVPQFSSQVAMLQSQLLMAAFVELASGPERLRHPPPRSARPTIEILRI